jgi:dephospho-CoA kinase
MYRRRVPLWRHPEDTTNPIITAKKPIATGKLNPAPAFPETAILFSMYRGEKYMQEHYETSLMTEQFPRFLRACPVYQIKGCNRLCFLDGGRGAPVKCVCLFGSIRTFKRRSSMYVIGLTGSIACGKSTASARLAELGATIVDADAISRRLTCDGGRALAAIRARFGDAVFDGASLDRRALGRIVFEDDRAREALEAILHPLVFEEIRTQLARARAQGVRVAVLDVPLLFETGLDALCDETFCVWTDEATQIDRLCRRDGLTADEARARIRAQMPLDRKLEKSDVHIDTSGTVEQTRARIDALYADTLQALEENA